jgi:hypothetical protein
MRSPSVATAEIEAVKAAANGEAPACLRRWPENPYRLVSLRDMLPFLAGDFVRASGIIGQIYAHVQYGVMPSDKSWGTLGGELGILGRSCEQLKLTNTLAQINRIKHNYRDGVSDVASFTRDIAEVHTRLIDELSTRMILIVSNPEYIRAFSPDSDPNVPTNIETEWSPVFASSAFPSAKYDVLKALKSYGFGRSTACVFHLMRVMELGLTALGTVFGVSLAHTNWAPAIEQIESKIREMHKDPNWKARPDCKEQKEFYSQAATYFGILKDAWRNYTMHRRGKYDEQEAADILTSVRAFMQKLTAGGLHE